LPQGEVKICSTIGFRNQKGSCEIFDSVEVTNMKTSYALFSVALALCVPATATHAQSGDSLAGKWLGDGVFRALTGKFEDAHCTIRSTQINKYNPTLAKYTVRAKCNMVSSKIDQAATLKGGTRVVSGSFENADRDENGVMQLRISDDRAHFRITSNKGFLNVDLDRF
jgi:glycine cleavage system regulatory protein